MPESAMVCPVTGPVSTMFSTMTDVRAKFVTNRLNLVICSRKVLCKHLNVDFADDTNICQLVPVFSKKQQGRGAEQFVAIEQRTLLVTAVGHVEANQTEALETADDFRVGQDFVLDHLAADAPVCVPVDQHGFFGVFRLFQDLLQFAHPGYRLPLLCRIAAALTGQRCVLRAAQGSQRVRLAAECAIPAGKSVDQQEQAEQ